MGPDDVLSRLKSGREVSEEKQERFEQTVIKRLFEFFDIPYAVRHEVPMEQPIEAFQFVANYIRNQDRCYPWEIIPKRVAAFDFWDLFARPTKSPLLAAWVDIHQDEHELVVMPFKVAKYGLMVMTEAQDFDCPLIRIPSLRVTSTPLAVLRLTDWGAYARAASGFS